MVKRKSYPLRISEEILLRVQQWAEDDLRSVNGQIEYLLREALRQSGRMKCPEEQAKEDKTDG